MDIQSILFDANKFCKNDSDDWFLLNDIHYASFKYKDYKGKHYLCYRLMTPDFMTNRYELVKLNDGIFFMIQIPKH
jgi:hypothetical protein